MPYLQLSDFQENYKDNRVKIMIFTEGTVLGPQNVFGHFNHAAYVPIKNCLNIIKSWKNQGARILYFTSRKNENKVQGVKKLLIKHQFPGECLYYRDKGQSYADIVEQVVPNILIEDDCRSIGGKWQMCITYVKPQVRNGINSIVVKEFAGIDHLPQSISNLLKNI